MLVFMSHASEQKATVEAVGKRLPRYFNVWIDASGLLAGESLAKTLEQKVNKDSDYFVLFVDEHSVKSRWVRQEIDWALDVEKRTGRTFILPIVVNRDAWKDIEPKELRDKLFIPCDRTDERGIDALAQEIAYYIHSWMARDIDRIQGMAQSNARKNDLEDPRESMKLLAVDILKIVYKHTPDNPITLREIYEQIKENDHARGMSFDEFRQWFDRIHGEDRMFQGTFYDGEELHTSIIVNSVRGQVYSEEKKLIARAALKLIRNDSIVALDGGSTTEAIAALISRSVRPGMIPSLSVVTNSVSAARVLRQSDSPTLKVYIAGGLVRATSLAVVGARDRSADSLTEMMDIVGQVDLAFVGTSGLTAEGLWTRTAEESRTKQSLLAPGARHVIVTDSSKFDLRLNHLFSNLENLHVITAMLDRSEELISKHERYRNILDAHNSVLSVVEPNR